jgi:hypothetical protein
LPDHNRQSKYYTSYHPKETGGNKNSVDADHSPRITQAELICGRRHIVTFFGQLKKIAPLF